MRKLKLLLLLLFISSISYAQHQVTGKLVAGDTGEPIPFASIILKGETRYTTTTDDNGKYSISLPSGEGVLVASFVGYKSAEVKISGRSIVDITLELDATTLDEAMVVAYGVVKKGSYSGSASVIKTDKIEDVPVVSFEQALAGNVTGLQLGNSSGLPGSFPEIRIRGVGSMNAGNDPLYVIDGIPAISGDLSDGNSGTSSMNFLNPSDIESITVLKDAAAASLYGSRAANGVILITTKKGKAGKTKFNFKAEMGFSNFAYDNFPLASEEETEMLYRETYRNKGMDDGKTGAALDSYVDTQVEKYYPARKPGLGYVDWQDELFRTAISQNYELSVSGGSESTRFFTSASYNKNEAISNARYMNRLAGTLNVDHKATKFMNLGVNVQYAYTEQVGNQENAGYDNPWWAAKSFLTWRWPAYNADGSYFAGKGFNGADEAYDPGNKNYKNPLINQENQITSYDQTRVLLKPWLEVSIVDGLKAKTIFGYDGVFGLEKFGWLKDHANGQFYGREGWYSERERTTQKLVSSTTLNYSKTFGDNHNISAMVGWEAENHTVHYSRIERINLTSVISTTLGSEIRNARGHNDENSMLSFISSLNYDYKAKYFLSGTFRRDGSSRLAEDSRWGDFWSVSGSWRVSNETFMRDIEWLNDLRLRASYGLSGTLPTELYYFRSLYSYSTYGKEGAYFRDTPENTDLTWEKNASTNLAIETRLFDRVGLTVDFYKKKSKDLLMETLIASISGYGDYLRNVGTMENRGVEIDINVDIIKKKDLTWNLGFNWTTNKNELTEMSFDGEERLVSGRPYIHKKGYSYYQFYGREYAGVDPATGKAQFYKNSKNADGSYDKTIVNSASDANQILLEGLTGDPDGYGGINTSLRYKNLSVSLLFNYMYGHHVWDQTQDQTQTDGHFRLYRSISKEQLRRWQNPGDITDVPRRTTDNRSGYYNSSRMALPGDYFRLKNMTISYNLPEKWVKAVNIERIRVYASGVNLFALSGLYFDPELPRYGGYVNFQTPPTRTISFGIEVSL